VSTQERRFPVAGSQLDLKWTLVQSKDGSLSSLDVSTTQGEEVESASREAVLEFVNRILVSAMSGAVARFFRRHQFSYIGQSLDGEYWLPGFRLAPADFDDATPTWLHLERNVFIDQMVDGIDDHHALAVADDRAKRIAARLSLLLDVGFYQPMAEFRWAFLPSEGDAGPRSERLQLGWTDFSPQLQTMPRKGELGPLGGYRSSENRSAVDWVSKLQCPRVARAVLRAANSDAEPFAVALDRCARLYQVALVAGRRYPTVRLAYKVASVEAAVQASGAYDSFAMFMRNHAPQEEGLDDVIAFLYKSVRSAHFHGGEFPFGEFAASTIDITDSGVLERFAVQVTGERLIRSALVRWLAKDLPDEELAGEPDGNA